MKKPLYEKDALVRAVGKARQNIETYKQGILKEEKIIEDYTALINEHIVFEAFIKAGGIPEDGRRRIDIDVGKLKEEAEARKTAEDGEAAET
jgi:hypothetical protein